MKSTLLTLTICVFLFCSATYSTQTSFVKRTPFKVYIEQDGIRLPITNNEVSLNKKQFNIVFVFPKPNGIIISTSFNKTTYEKALKNEPLSKLPGFTESGMAEYLLNPDKEVMIDDTAPSYWYYDNDKEHRFNKVVKSRDSLVCTREIKQLYILGGKEPVIMPIEQVNKPLYFVFVDYESDPKTFERKEIQREMIKINWN
jgi:hypothetical protein